LKNTWEPEEESKLDYNQEMLALSKEESVELEFEELPDEDCPYWEE